MTMPPILAALRRHKVAVLLIVLQFALTLAIVSNAIFIIGQRIERMNRPTGIDEHGLIRILQQWPAAHDGDDAASIEKLDALQRTDLDTLRSLPDVQDVAASSSNPVLGGYTAGQISLNADQKGISVRAAYYYGDQHLRPTFGLHLIAGRDFNASEIRHGHPHPDSPVIIVSKPVADQLFPSGGALGQTVYQDGKPATIIGIVERLQTPKRADSNWAYNSVLEPLREDGYMQAMWFVRVQGASKWLYAKCAKHCLQSIRCASCPSRGLVSIRFPRYAPELIARIAAWRYC